MHFFLGALRIMFTLILKHLFIADGMAAPSGDCSGGWFCTGSSYQAEPIDTSSTVDPSACSCPAMNYTGGKCGPGYYCPPGASYPIDCDGGSYCSQAELSAPEGECDAGRREFLVFLFISLFLTHFA